MAGPEDVLTPEKAEALEKILKSVVENLPQINTLITQFITSLQASGGELDENVKMYSELAKVLLQGKDANEAATAAIAEQVGLFEITYTAAQKNTLQVEAIVGALEQIITVLQDQGQLTDTNTKGYQNQLKALKEQLKVQKEQATRDKQKTKDLDAHLARAKRLKAIVLEAQTKRAGAGTGGPGGPLAAFFASPPGGPSIGETFVDAGKKRLQQASAAFTGMSTKAENMYQKVSKASTEFASLTGQVMNTDFAVRLSNSNYSSFAETLVEMQEELAILGIKVEDVGKAFADAAKASQTFRNLMGRGTVESKKQADAMANIMLVVSKMGIPVANFSKTIDDLAKTYKRTNIVAQTKGLATELVNVARLTDQLPKEVAEAFDKYMESTGAFYTLKTARKEFAQLSLISAETAIKVGDMTKAMGKFDTWEGSVTAVAKLNAMLRGPYLDALSMHKMSEKDRMKAIREAIKLSGLDIDAMGDNAKYLIKFAADATTFSLRNTRRLLRTRSKLEIAEDTARKKRFKTGAKTYTELAGNLSDGAARNAVSLKASLDAAEESAYLTKKAFTMIDTEVKNVAKTIRFLGSQVKTFIESSVTTALGALQSALALANKEMKTNPGMAVVMLSLARSGINKVLMGKMGLDQVGNLLESGWDAFFGAPETAGGPTEERLPQPTISTTQASPVPETVAGKTGITFPTETALQAYLAGLSEGRQQGGHAGAVVEETATGTVTGSPAAATAGGPLVAEITTNLIIDEVNFGRVVKKAAGKWFGMS